MLQGYEDRLVRVLIALSADNDHGRHVGTHAHSSAAHFLPRWSRCVTVPSNR